MNFFSVSELFQFLVSVIITIRKQQIFPLISDISYLTLEISVAPVLSLVKIHFLLTDINDIIHLNFLLRTKQRLRVASIRLQPYRCIIWFGMKAIVQMIRSHNII